jgi:CheY-like chemotaxis protein
MIVDDSNIIRRRIERSQQIDRLEVVGAASNGREAVELFRRTQPDVVTMDLTMPEMDGIECVQQLVAINSKVLILVVSALADKATAVEAIEKGRKRLFVQALHRSSAQRRIGRAAVGGLMLKEAEIRTFIEGTTNYFEISAQQSASVGSPYLVTDGKPGAYEYTGIIGISGARKGIVYFTAPRGMLTVLLMRMQETDTSDANIMDLVGEVANTISGNARRDFGKISSFRCRRSLRTTSRRSPRRICALLRDSDQLAHSFRQTRRLPGIAHLSGRQCP